MNALQLYIIIIIIISCCWRFDCLIFFFIYFILLQNVIANIFPMDVDSQTLNIHTLINTSSQIHTRYRLFLHFKCFFYFYFHFILCQEIINIKNLRMLCISNKVLRIARLKSSNKNNFYFIK